MEVVSAVAQVSSHRRRLQKRKEKKFSPTSNRLTPPLPNTPRPPRQYRRVINKAWMQSPSSPLRPSLSPPPPSHPRRRCRRFFFFSFLFNLNSRGNVLLGARLHPSLLRGLLAARPGALLPLVVGAEFETRKRTTRTCKGSRIDGRCVETPTSFA